MTLTPEERKAVIEYRLERSDKTLIEAKDNAQLGHWNLVANRLYYCVYYAGSALLLSRHLSASTHAGFVRMIGLHFIKTGVIDSKYSRLINDLFHNRQTGDYDDIFDLTEEDVYPHIAEVEELIKIFKDKLRNQE